MKRSVVVGLGALLALVGWVLFSRDAAVVADHGLTPLAARPTSPNAPATTMKPHRDEPTSTPRTAELRVEVRRGQALDGVRVRSWRDLERPEARWQEGASALTTAGVARLLLEPGRWLLSVETADGLRAQQTTWHSLEAPATVRFELAAPRVIDGVVVARRSQEPIAGATLTLGDATFPEASTRSTTTDTRGRFSLTVGVSEGELTASAPGFSPSTVALRDGLRVELSDCGFITGVVLGTDGNPIAGARVVAQNEHHEHVDTTSASGAFSLEVGAGSWVLSARAASGIAVRDVPVPVTPGETRGDIVLRLVVGGRVEGVVRDALTRAPLAGAEVIFRPPSHAGELLRTQTATDGTFTASPFTGPVDVLVRAAGYAELSEPGFLTNPGGVVRFDAELLRPGSLAGTVETTAGAPLRDVTLRLEGLASVGATQSDGRGLFSFENVPTGIHWLVAERDGSPTHRVQVPVRPGQRNEVQLRLEVEQHRVSGQVLDVEGRPAAGATVTARQGQEGLRAVVAGADGRFAVGLTPGRWLINAEKPALHGVQGVTVEQHDLTDVVVRLQSLVSGRRCLVLDEDGHAAPGATVSISSEGFELSRVSDEQGFVDLALAPPLRATVRAGDRGRLGVLELPAGATECTVRLAPPAQVRVHLTHPPPERVIVSIPGGLSFTEYGTTLQFDGSDAVLPVPAGTHTLIFSSASLRALPSVTVSAGESVSLEVNLVDWDAGR